MAPFPITRRKALLMGVAAGALTGLAAPALGQGAPRVRLRLMETTDLHVNVLPYDYYRDREDDTVGLAKTAALVKAARAEARNHLLFDNGDLLQGSPMGDWVAYTRGMKPGDVHPMVAAMNELAYDCGTLGNHEFNYGLDFMAAAFQTAKFPVVCANVVKADGTPLVAPTRVIEKTVTDEAGGTHTLRVGVIGFVPPQITQWDKNHLEGKVRAIDIVEAAERHVPELRKACDVLVALCHSGIAGGARRGGEENAALHLARVPGIDAILLGHQHLVFPGSKDFRNVEGADADRGTLHGVPAVMPGFWGSHLGLIDLDLERSGPGWKVAGFKVEARPIYERKDRQVVPLVKAEGDVAGAVKAQHEATLAYVRQPVGETRASINSYWALVADDPSVQIVSQAQVWYVKPLAANLGLGNLPVLSAAAPFKSGGRGGPDYYTDVKPGPVAIKDVADIYLYPNTLQAVRITGAQVREWLERSAGIFNRIDPAKTEEQPLINGAFPAFNFDVIDGVTYKIDVTQPSRYDLAGKLADPNARRIVDLAFEGKPLRDDQEFIVATNNYRAGGGGNFPGADGKTTVIEAPDTNRDVIVRYIVEQKTINPSADGNWSFAPVPASANVVFVTSPAAERALPAGLKATRAGEAPDGFAKYRLTLG